MTRAEPTGGDIEIVNVRRRQDRSLKTRQAILQGGLAEFAASGFEGATTRSIAKRAEVPHGLVIYHFETKLGVWQAVMEGAFEHLHGEFRKSVDALQGRDAETVLRALHRNFIEVSVSRPELNWLFSHEVSGSTERLNWILGQIRTGNIDFMLDLIRQLQAEGRYVDGDPAHLHFLFAGAASRVFALAPEIEYRTGTSPFDDEFVQRHVDLCDALFFVDPPEPRKKRSLVG